MKAINFYIVHMAILIIAEFVWSFFVFFVSLKILRKNEMAFTKKFYLFIIFTSLTSVVINRVFEYVVQSAPIASDIWAKVELSGRLGIGLVPTFLLMYIYFTLASSILHFRAKEALFVTLVLGVANSPWRLLL